MMETTLSELERTRLIAEIATVIRGETVPPDAKAAGLTFIGWLARRMPHDVCGNDMSGQDVGPLRHVAGADAPAPSHVRCSERAKLAG